MRTETKNLFNKSTEFKKQNHFMIESGLFFVWLYFNSFVFQLNL